jgi:uncharacterized protein YjiK
MMGGSVRAGFLLWCAAAAGCRAEPSGDQGARDSATLAERESRLSTVMARSDTVTDGPLARWVLPPALSEISGLALTKDQRLLAHGDESGRVFEVDYRRGQLVKSFLVGTQLVRDDLEAITVSDDRMFLLASGGRIYEFAEGANGARVPFKVHDTQLGADCEFEGLAFDPKANALVLACKNVLVKGLKDFVVLYRYTLAGDSSQTTQIRIPSADAVGTNGWKGFTPSDLTIDPASGDYLILSAQEKGLLRVTPSGEVVWSRPLPPGHEMAEGIAITRDGLLIVSDESTSKTTPGAITLYRWR